MDKLKQPRRTDMNPMIDHKKDFFGGGQYSDPAVPASEIPNNGVRNAFNMLLYPDYAEVRPGTEKHSDLIPPFVADRVTYLATKTDYIITITFGQSFSQEDVDYYFYWPISGRRDLILEVINETQIRVKHSDAEGPATASMPGKIMPPENAKRFWHSASNKLYAIFGEKVYSTSWDMDSWTEIQLSSSRLAADKIISAYSIFDANKSWIYLINPNGVFVIDTTMTPMEMWKSNTACQDNTIVETEEDVENTHGNRYLTCSSRLSGFVTQNRLNASIVIQQESGPNNPNKTDETNKDFAEVWSPSYSGSTVDSYESLVGNTNTRSIAEWKAITDGAFNCVGVGGTGNRTVGALDFSGIVTKDDVAAIIQIALNTYYIDISFTYNAVTNAFTLYPTNDKNGSLRTVRYFSKAYTGTEIFIDGYLNMGNPSLVPAGEGGTIVSTNLSTENTRSIGPITIPVNARHWTHIPIYRTNDLAVATTSQERYVLAAEIPIGKAFDAYRDNADGHIHISPGGNGEFAEADVLCAIKFADGTTDTISGFISSTEVVGSGVLATVVGQGAAIGNGRVMTAKQVGTVITAVTGDSFLTSDVGMRVWWADGYYSFILEYVNATTVIAETSSNHTQQGLTINPTSRYFNDTVEDQILNDRASQYPLYTRFWQPLPLLDAGAIVPGFIIVSKAGIDEIHYSMLRNKHEYLGGYYNDYLQIAPIKDKIIHFSEFKDMLLIYCSNSTYWIATNTTLAMEVPDIGEYVSVISGVNLLDEKIGVFDAGSVQKIPNGIDIVFTNEPGVRTCNGGRFGQNFAVDNQGRSMVLNDLQKTQQKTASGYDANKLGYLIFFSDEAPDN